MIILEGALKYVSFEFVHRMQLAWITYRATDKIAADVPVPSCSDAITFDSILAPNDQYGVKLPNGYSGVNWPGWTVVNAAQAVDAVASLIANNNAPLSEIMDNQHALYAIGWVS